MKKFSLIALALVSNSFFISLYAQEVKVIKYAELKSIIEEENDKTKVINFWATWCRPCVKELPQFIALNERYGGENLEISLISFDFTEDLNSKLKPFVNKKNINAKVYLLDETDYNAFIDKIDPSWSGAIPATLFVGKDNKKRNFFEKEFEEEELEKTYLNFIK